MEILLQALPRPSIRLLTTNAKSESIIATSRSVFMNGLMPAMEKRSKSGIRQRPRNRTEALLCLAVRWRKRSRVSHGPGSSGHWLIYQWPFFFFPSLRRSPGASSTAPNFEPILPSMSVGGEKAWSDPKHLGLDRSLVLYVSPMAGFFPGLSIPGQDRQVPSARLKPGAAKCCARSLYPIDFGISHSP
jgi:hypothetical protein